MPVCTFINELHCLNNQEMFQTTSSIWNINERNKHYLRRPNANLT